MNDWRWISWPWESYWETLQLSPNGPYPSQALMDRSPFLFPLSSTTSKTHISSVEIALIPLSHFSHSPNDSFFSLHIFCHCTTFSLILLLSRALTLLFFPWLPFQYAVETTSVYLFLFMCVCVSNVCPINVFTTAHSTYSFYTFATRKTNPDQANIANCSAQISYRFFLCASRNHTIKKSIYK